MKAKSLFISILTLITISPLFMSMSQNPMGSIRGYINYYGNAPVETPAFKSDDGKIYLLEIDPTAQISLDELLLHAGEHLELSGQIETEESKFALPISQNGTIIITSYKRIF